MSESGPRTRVLSLVRFYEDWLNTSRPIEFNQRVQLRRELSERNVPTQSMQGEMPLRAVSSYPLLLPSGHRSGGVHKRRRRPSQPFVATRKSEEHQAVIEVKQAVKEKREKSRRKRDTKRRRVSAHPKLERLDDIKSDQVEVPIQLNIYPAQEILSSERSYVNSLLMMSHAYLKPIEDGRQTLSADPHRIFANIRSIIELNKIFLTHLEGRRINEWNKMPKSEQLVGDLFVDQADLFKIYIEYCVNYHEAYALVQELKHSSESFNRFAAKSNQYGSVLDLNDLLIMPVQRVPRYKMLLENLLKFTLESHPDYQNLKAAIDKMGSLADLINAKLKEQKSQRRMAYIASRLPEESTEAVDLIAPTRRLIAEFTFTSFKVKVHSGDVQALAKPQQVYFFLFNDKILLAKGFQTAALTAASSDSFSLASLSAPDLGLNMIIKDTHLPARMEPIAFFDLQSSFLRKILNAPNALTFQLVNPKGYYVLQASSETDKNQLKESFREALMGLHNDARLKRSLIRVFTDEKSHFGICEAIEHAPAFSERIPTQDLALVSNKETIRALEDLLETNRVVLQSRPVTPSPMKKRREKKVIEKLKSAITVFSPRKSAKAKAAKEDKENVENLGTQAEAIVKQIDDLKKRQQELRYDGAKTPPYATPPTTPRTPLATPRTPMATPRVDPSSSQFATPRLQSLSRTPLVERELLFETPKSERHSRRKSITNSVKKSGIKMKKAERHVHEATPRKGLVPSLDLKKMELVN